MAEEAGDPPGPTRQHEAWRQLVRLEYDLADPLCPQERLVQAQALVRDAEAQQERQGEEEQQGDPLYPRGLPGCVSARMLLRILERYHDRLGPAMVLQLLEQLQRECFFGVVARFRRRYALQSRCLTPPPPTIRPNQHHH